MVVSSANFHISMDSPGRSRSLIIARNSQGPSRVPCGTPAVTFSQVEKVPCSFTLCCLSLRKSMIQFREVGLTSRLNSLAINVWWSTKSKAFRKSTKAVLIAAPVPSVAPSQWCNIEMSAKVVEEPGMKPY